MGAILKLLLDAALERGQFRQLLEMEPSGGDLNIVFKAARFWEARQPDLGVELVAVVCEALRQHKERMIKALPREHTHGVIEDLISSFIPTPFINETSVKIEMYGNTALMWATASCHRVDALPKAKLLIEYGASTLLKDKDGRTVLDRVRKDLRIGAAVSQSNPLPLFDQEKQEGAKALIAYLEANRTHGRQVSRPGARGRSQFQGFEELSIAQKKVRRDPTSSTGSR